MPYALPKPLPRFLKDEEVEQLFKDIESIRDRAIFYLMLRCGLRVEEVVNLHLDDLDFRRGRVVVKCGKGGKGRVVYMSSDAHSSLVEYLRGRPKTKAKALFLVDKGTLRGKPISVRGSRKGWSSMPKSQGLKPRAISFGTQWRRSCSMPIRTWSLCKIFSDTVGSRPPRDTAGSRI